MAGLQDDLSSEEREVYQWQMWVEGFGEAGQRKLKGASVMVSRCGGLGGNVAWQLAAAGVGQLVLAHGGNLKPSDLNRQTLMTHGHVGKPRIEAIVASLKELNPRVEIVAVGENVSEANAAKLVSQADVVVDCAPLFEERYLMNREVVRQKKVMVECAVFDCEVHVTSFKPGITPCLACLYPAKSTSWVRQFPVFGAVACAAGGLAATEVIKILGGIGEPLYGKLLVGDLRTMEFRRLRVRWIESCSVCGIVKSSNR